MSIKTKLSRIGIYVALWMVLTFFLLFLYYDENAPFFRQFIVTLLVTGLTALPAYISAQRLVPAYLYPRRIKMFIGSIVLLAVVSTAFTYLIAAGLYSLLSGKALVTNTRFFIIIFPLMFIANSITIGISSAIRIISDRFGIEHELEKSEGEKKATELSYLRAQINPHFLFNVLNTIYFQINKENSKARSSVEKFSEMLRYQLYDCNTDLIEISKELSYIRNYIEIQQLRMEEGTELKMNIQEDIEAFKIAPMLILPLIENGFKYISSYKEPHRNKLHINILVENASQLVVKVFNTRNRVESVVSPANARGLGLKNMERRLALLYPDNHTLNKQINDDSYEIILKIRIAD